jgi:uncharacterized membrane protein YkvA (DUF1232 family)
VLTRLKAWAKDLKRDVVALWLAARDARVPWHAKAVAAAVAAYALSPIDLIPDFVPVIGYLDDLIIVPAGIWLAVRLVPGDVLDELREAAAKVAERPVSRAGLALIVAIWVMASVMLLDWLVLRR